VDASESATTVVVSANVADPSGVAVATVALGQAEPVALTPLGGDRRSGTWTAPVVVPAGTAYGPLPLSVVATDLVGNVARQDASVTVADVVPAPPASVAVAADPAGAAVSWTPPPANGGSPVEGYDVTVSAGGTTLVTASTDTLTATVGGLVAGTAYEVAVAARNAAGTGRPAVTTSTLADGAPSLPANVTATPGDGTIDVAWAASADAVAGYRVTATPAAGVPASIAVGASTATIGGLSNGVPYAVSVSAVGLSGPGPAATAEATPRTRPGVPAIGAADAGDAKATVTWTAPAADGGAPVTAYRVTAYPGGRSWTLPETARGATVGPLPNGAGAAFTVAAVNAAGAGSPSEPSNAVVPRRPVQLRVMARAAGTVTYGSASHVTAAVVTAAGTAVPGDLVELYARRAGTTTWKRVAYGSTGSTGRVILSATLAASSALRLHHPTGPDIASDVAVPSVGVAPRLSRVANTTRLRVGHTLVVTGSVAPAHPAGSPVRLQTWTASGWHTVANGATTSTTAYRVSWKPSTAAVRTMRVVKPADTDHVTGASASWREVIDPQNVADVAHDILGMSRIALDARHVSGVVDAATAWRDTEELAAGQLAQRSAYENAPGGSTPVDLRVVRAIRAMGQRGTVTVTEIAGGSHAPGSTHYSGRAVDIRVVNGVPVRPGSGYGWVVDLCRSYGAARVFYPAYDPYGGHQNHVHCDW
jgi:hypothetical protein